LDLADDRWRAVEIGITLHAADDDTASITLTVQAHTNDNVSGQDSAIQTIDLTVNPVAETPTLTATAAANNVDEDGRGRVMMSSMPFRGAESRSTLV
jgi:hypothetical protein